VRVERVIVGDLESNCWVVDDGLGGPVIVVDPGDDAGRILEAVGDSEVAAVVLTHAHFDHLGAATRVLEVTRAPLLVHEMDARRLTSAAPDGTGGALFGYPYVAPAADRLLVESDRIAAGQLDLLVIHTPGHTQGGACFFAEDPQGGSPHLFSGDTLFAGSVGRSDFPGGDARQLSRSIASKLAPLPPETVVHPGHGPDTTIGREARINPFWPRG
jgi:glyoxylase-like metal-dependent hydrolase (beta-lactamase superfamily II)